MAEEFVTKKVTLKSSDDQLFEVPVDAAMLSQTIRHMIEDDCVDSAIPLPNVTARALAKVIEYCRKHAEMDKQVEDSTSAEFELRRWDEEYIKVDQNDLFHLILAANYLNIKGLLDLTCKTVADMMKGKTPEQLREQFGIVNDYTPEEEEEVRRENQWAFE